MTNRERKVLGGIAYGLSVAAVLAAALMTLPEVGILICVPAVVAVAAALLPMLRLARPIWWVPAVTLITCGVSLAVTFLYSGPAVNATANWWLLETGALLVLVVPAIRHPTPPTSLALGALLIATVTVSPVRVLQGNEPRATYGETTRLCLAWALLAAASVGCGCYLRSLDSRSRAAVVTERRAQRLDLARDLHDFAAHDVTGVVVLAQAAQVLAREDPLRAIELLPSIEAAGAQALAAMDRTVQIFAETDTVVNGRVRWREDTGPLAAVADGLYPSRDMDELPSLVARFTRTGSVEAHLDLVPGALDELPPAASGLGYRVVVEALTNVRRHAAGATTVRISVFRVDAGVPTDALHVVIADDGQQSSAAPDLTAPDRQGGGFGLAGLTERIGALGGTLTAGPDRAGWRVTAVLPLATLNRARTPESDCAGSGNADRVPPRSGIR